MLRFPENSVTESIEHFSVERVDESKSKREKKRPRCSAKIYPAAKNYPPPVTSPSVLSAVCIAQNWYLADSLLIE